ncbi:MAG TPA: hypothetical protein VGI81_20395 [Tepidisphaeraceae bacterium]|jgi:hypothetical protein
MARRSRSRQVEIFNFSFLDILACTIGLLIFIMVMVFILQSGSPVADTTAIINQRAEEMRQYQASADQDSAIAAQLEQQLSHIRDTVSPELRVARDDAARQNHARRAEYDQAIARLHGVEAELATARAERRRKSDAELRQAHVVLDAAVARNEAAKAAVARAIDAPSVERLRFLPSRSAPEVTEDYRVLHVDCRATEVVFLERDSAGNMCESDRCAAAGLWEKDSAFSRLVYQHARAEHPLVLLWVRPDGIETFNRVMRAMPKGIACGYEPANSEWHFDGALER